MEGFRSRLSESEKGKGVASSLSPSIDQSSGSKLLGVAARARRDISGDVADLIVGRLDGAVNIPNNLGKNDEVVGSDSDLLSVRVENNGGKAVAVDARDGSVDLKSAEVVWCRSIPFRLVGHLTTIGPLDTFEGRIKVVTFSQQERGVSIVRGFAANGNESPKLGGENFTAATEVGGAWWRDVDPKVGNQTCANEAVVEGSIDPVVDAHPSKKKKKKKMAGSTESWSRSQEREGKGDRSRSSPSPGRSRRSEDDLPLALKETPPLVERDLWPWGGPDPPFKKPLLASSEHLSFRYNKDAPFASDPDSCAELVRRIRAAVIRKNQLILDYEMTLRKMASDFIEAETVIETKDAEIAKLKKDALDKAKGMVAERSRYFRERKQAIETAASLEEELENARRKVAQLEVEKADEAGRTKRAIDRMRQTHRRELTSATSCIGAAATDWFEKFRQYIADRDRREVKLLLHSQAFGTLESMGTLEEFGMHIPKKLKVALAANDAMFRKEREEVTVVGITEQDFVLPRFPGLDALQGSEHPATAPSSSSGDLLKHTTSGVHAGRPLGSSLGISTQETLIERREPPIADSKGMEVAGVTGVAASSPIAED
ncbi:hypothetical protein Bca52824_064308 [Brassica carinata]|uniref:Uncharacterized protein n=1 Tax=Brassica carinata TaxID=52824 RepID=A0A8X7QH83_BRACI|nr:hypothetical protein Bca52824_064308 [Brassica carinata]